MYTTLWPHPEGPRPLDEREKFRRKRLKHRKKQKKKCENNTLHF